MSHVLFSHHDVHVENYSKKKLEKSFVVRSKYLQVASYMDNTYIIFVFVILLE